MTDASGRTLLFFAVDIAAGTRFKETAPAGHGWLPAFETFFKELPLVVMGQVGLAFAEADDVPEIGIWKALGDELIFRAEPRNVEEAALLTEACYRGLVAYDARLSSRWPLRLRGCVWAARFPERNIEIALREIASDGPGVHVDYLGPDIDLGFRLSSQPHHGQMAISMNLAEAIADTAERRGMRFHYVGKRLLKGVFMGRPYPLILATFEDCMPDPWEWEREEREELMAVRDRPPTPAADLVAFVARIRSYLNRTTALDLKKLEF